jgi:hypothetical protein
MREVFGRGFFPRRGVAISLILSILLLVSLVPAPALAQTGTSIPGSGTGGTTQGNGTSATANQSGSGNNSSKCSGTIGCLGSMVQHGANTYISAAQASYNFANPLNSQGGGQELSEAQRQAKNATGDAASAAKQLPGPWDMLMGVVGKAVSGFVNFVLNIVNGIIWALFALPAPGSAFDIGTWFSQGAPPLSGNTSIVSNTSASANNSANTTANITAIQPMVEGGGVDRSVLPAGMDFDAWWDAVWKVYAGLAGLATLILLVTGIFSLSSSTPTPRERNERLRDLSIAAGLIVFGPIIMPAILHFGNIMAAGLAPNAAELLNSPGDILKIGSATGFALIGSYISITVMAIGLGVSVVVSFAQWLLTFFVAATWVVWAGLYGSQNATLKAWSRVGFATLGILVGLKIFQALLFRIAWLLPVSFSDPAESIMSLILFPILLYVIFYKLPKYATKKAVPTFVSTVGSSRGGGAHFTYDNSTQRNFIHDIDSGTNNPDPGGDGSGGRGGSNDDPSNSSDDGGGSGSGRDGGVGGGGGDSSGGNDSGSKGDGPDRVRTRGDSNDMDVDSGTNNPDGGSDSDGSAAGSREGSDRRGSNSTGSRSSTGPPTDEELREALDQESAGGNGSRESNGNNEVPPEVRQRAANSGGKSESVSRARSRDDAADADVVEAVEEIENEDKSIERGGTGDSVSEEMPAEMREHVSRMEESNAESREDATEGGRAQTRGEGSGDGETTEIVEEVKDRPSADSSGGSGSNSSGGGS